MSRLRTALERYVGMRQGLGYKYHDGCRISSPSWSLATPKPSP